MAQETWGLKLDSELKEKVQDIIKNNFESSKDFLEQVVNLYELSQAKQDGSVLSDEITELESITRRINGIFINANAKINTMLIDKDTKSLEQINMKQDLIERLQGTIKELEEEKEKISAINDDLVNSNTEYKQQMEQLSKTNHTLEELILEYRNKNDTLAGSLSEYKSEHEKNKKLQGQIIEFENTVRTLTSSNKEQAKENALLNNTIKELKESHQHNLESKISEYERILNTSKEQAKIEYDRVVLEQQKKHQTEIQTLQEKHNAEIEQYQKKYKELLEEIESIRKEQSERKK